MKKIMKPFGAVLFILVVLWGNLSCIDYNRVCSAFEKPYFAIPTATTDDGGSGKYVGLGYSFDIEGNFMPEDELPGVTKADYYLFGMHLKSAVRD